MRKTEAGESDEPCSPCLLRPRRQPIWSTCDIFLAGYDVFRSFLHSDAEPRGMPSGGEKGLPVDAEMPNRRYQVSL
jgi:hypothetical protein